MEKLKKWLNKHCTVNWCVAVHYRKEQDSYVVYFYPPGLGYARSLSTLSKKKIKDYLKGQGLWKS